MYKEDQEQRIGQDVSFKPIQDKPRPVINQTMHPSIHRRSWKSTYRKTKMRFKSAISNHNPSVLLLREREHLHSPQTDTYILKTTQTITRGVRIKINVVKGEQEYWHHSTTHLQNYKDKHHYRNKNQCKLYLVL